MAVRTVFAPDSWPLRVTAYDAAGHPKTGTPVAQDVAGPCCFMRRPGGPRPRTPPLAAGDHVALLDTGAYYFSNPFSYNSLPRPAIHGFTTDATEVRFATVRTAQTLPEIVKESGGNHSRSLTTLT